jgi:hypothetical protein
MGVHRTFARCFAYGSAPGGIWWTIRKGDWWASPIFFVPRTRWRTWGTRPSPVRSCDDRQSHGMTLSFELYKSTCGSRRNRRSLDPWLRSNPTRFRLVRGGRGHSQDSVLLPGRVCRAPGFCRLSPVGRREERTVPRLPMGRPGRSPRVVRGFSRRWGRAGDSAPVHAL